MGWGGMGCEEKLLSASLWSLFSKRSRSCTTDFLIGAGFHISICFLDMVTYKAFKIFILFTFRR